MEMKQILCSLNFWYIIVETLFLSIPKKLNEKLFSDILYVIHVHVLTKSHYTNSLCYICVSKRPCSFSSWTKIERSKSPEFLVILIVEYVFNELVAIWLKMQLNLSVMAKSWLLKCK